MLGCVITANPLASPAIRPSRAPVQPRRHKHSAGSRAPQRARAAGSPRVAQADMARECAARAHALQETVRHHHAQPAVSIVDQDGRVSVIKNCGE